MNNSYVIIYTHDNGGHWQATGLAYDNSEASLRAMRECMAANPDLRYEMHVVHPNLYAAFNPETHEPFF